MADTGGAFDSPASAETYEPIDGHVVIGAVEARGSAVVLPVAGDIDMLTAPQFEEALASALRDQPEVLVVDLDKVEFFTSAGLTAMVGAFQQAGDRTALRVVATNSATVRPLQVTALDRKIPVYASREQAVAG